MAERTELTGDKLSELLSDGWGIKGYSVCMLAAGFLAHNILLQKEKNLKSLTIMTGNGEEEGRILHQFAPTPPAPEKKKGFWG